MVFSQLSSLYPLASFCFVAVFLLTGCNKTSDVMSTLELESKNKLAEQQREESVKRQQVTSTEVVIHYADIAHATYEDAWIRAKDLQNAIAELINQPSGETLLAARAAWKDARVPYQQSEVFRFGNPVVDNWEGQLNAWPLDEGLIDYVDTSYYEHLMGNQGATANIIANTELTIGTSSKDLSTITPELLIELNEVGGSEANVATGYHAIEFLLWGQDLNGTALGAGARPASDYRVDATCTGGNCARRVQYLQAVVLLLVNDLEYMTGQWALGGDYRQTLLAEPPERGLRRMFYGMGSLSLGELAGERMKVALEANSVEDEHDCFSDNTHNSHFYDAKGIRNVYTGNYLRRNGSVLSGPSLSELIRQYDAKVDAELQMALATTEDTLGLIVASAEAPNSPMTFDMMIAEGNLKGHEMISAGIHALVVQTGMIEQAAKALGIAELNPETANHTF